MSVRRAGESSASTASIHRPATISSRCWSRRSPTAWFLPRSDDADPTTASRSKAPTARSPSWKARETPQFLFCATGTGVSPFHCFARTTPGLPYRLLHGVRTREDFRETREFMPERYVPCVSRGPAGDGAFPGRLTDVLKKEPIDPSTYCYLCGNSDMIYEVYGILKDHGVPRDRIFAEVYF